MTIERITLENFKCFAALELPCAPLTLLTGHNAGGKSTALQALLLLAQGLRDAPNTDLLPLNGTLIDLGSGGDVIHHFAFEQTLSLGAVGCNKNLTWRFAIDKDDSARGLMRLTAISYAKDGEPVSVPNNRILPYQLSKTDLVDSLRTTTFIGAGREMRLDAYPIPRSSAHIRGDVGPSGEYAPYWYLEFADDEVGTARRHPSDERETVRAQTDAWLNELFPGARANAERLAVDAPIRLSFSLSQTSPWSRPANVGYGLSYAFPMLVALLTTKGGSTIVVDSAEAHLHPRAQSAVGRLLAQMAGAGLQIFVESHSDHLLNGVRIAIRDGLLNPNDAAIHFFNRVGHDPSTIMLAVDRNGTISDWPEGFFDQTERDLAALSGWT